MPNSKQAKKRMRQDEERRVANKAKASAMKTAIKSVLQAESPEAAKAALPNAMKHVDKCSKANILHNNAAARKKAQLSRAASN